MPPHPIHASYCHVIESGLENTNRMINENADAAVIKNELQHLQATNRILTDFLLYFPHDPRFTPEEHERYWNEIRPNYMIAAETKSIDNLCVAWEFLARATRGYDFYCEIQREGDTLRKMNPELR